MLNGRSDRRETWHIVVFFEAKYNFAIFDDVTRAQNAQKRCAKNEVFQSMACDTSMKAYFHADYESKFFFRFSAIMTS